MVWSNLFSCKCRSLLAWIWSTSLITRGRRGLDSRQQAGDQYLEMKPLSMHRVEFNRNLSSVYK